MYRIWNTDEEAFLKNNYSQLGATKCAEILQKDRSKVVSKVLRLKLHKNVTICNAAIKKIDTPESAYILGLLWADGSYHKHYITLSTSIEDAKEIEPTIQKTGEWHKYERIGRLRNGKKSKNSIEYKIYSIDLGKWFDDFDYHQKSITSPTKILNAMPYNLRHYFYLGVTDGDGCFYYHKKRSIRQFNIASTFDQDWSYMVQLCNSLYISKYSIKRQRKINKKSGKLNSSSSFRITNKLDIQKIGSYLYQGYLINPIGLKRKLNKYTEMMQK
jgi:hypothetical protein